MLKAFFMTDKGPFVLSNRFLTYIRRVMTGAWRFFIALLCLVWLIPFSSKVNDDEWFYRCHWIYRPLQKLRNYVRKKKRSWRSTEHLRAIMCFKPVLKWPILHRKLLLQVVLASWTTGLVVKTGWRSENWVKVFFSVHGAFSSKRWSI